MCDQGIDQSAMSIQSLLNTSRSSFLMTSHIRSALWTLHIEVIGCFIEKSVYLPFDMNFFPIWIKIAKSATSAGAISKFAMIQEMISKLKENISLPLSLVLKNAK